MKDDGGPFHPSTFGLDGSIGSGASFREVAAMHAMAAMLANSEFMKVMNEAAARTGKSWDATSRVYVNDAIRLADALIAELKK